MHENIFQKKMKGLEWELNEKKTNAVWEIDAYVDFEDRSEVDFFLAIENTLSNK